MALFKTQANLIDLFTTVISTIIETPELFPSRQTMKEEGGYSDKTLEHIETERTYLALVYLLIFTAELAQKNKIKGFKSLDQDAMIFKLSTIFGVALNSVAISEVNIVEEVSSYMDSFASEGNLNDNYFKAYQTFQDRLFPNIESKDVPINLVTLAKFIRLHVVERLVGDLVRSYAFKIEG